MTIRTAQPADLDFFVECVNDEGWLSESRESFGSFFAHDSNGCFVAEADQRRIGMCVATSYGDCGYLGELIVIPSQRAQGYGTLLMKHAVAYLRTRGCRSIYLDGDLPAVPIYEKLGFRTVTRSLRFLGNVSGGHFENVRVITPEDLTALRTADLAAFGSDRSFFLRRRLETCPDLCFAQISNRMPVGFIMGQPGQGVVTVGPWLATAACPDPLDLLRALATACGDRKLRVGVLESNQVAASMMRSLASFTETEASIRMVLGPDAGLGMSETLLAIGSPAKG